MTTYPVQSAKGYPDKLLAFIGDFWQEHGYGPSIREMQDGCEIPTTSTVSYHLTRLRERRLITWEREIARTAKLVAVSPEVPHCPTCRCGEAHS